MRECGYADMHASQKAIVQGRKRAILHPRFRHDRPATPGECGTGMHKIGKAS